MSLFLPLVFMAINLYVAYRSFKMKQWLWMGLSLAFASYAGYSVGIQLL